MSEEAPLPQSRAEDMNSMQDDRAEDDGMMKEEGESMNNNNGDGSCHLRPIFFGNLSHGCMAGDVEGIFERLVVDSRGGDDNGGEFLVLCVLCCVCLMII